METRLQAIAERGVPNYFGAQRFGIGGSNLQGAMRWAESGAPVRDRNKRSFWLSAARSALFNQQVSIRLKKTEFNQVVDGDALQLAGRGSWFVVTPEELEVSQARVHNRELMITATLPGSGDWGSQRDALGFRAGRDRRGNRVAGAAGTGESRGGAPGDASLSTAAQLELVG